MSRSSRSLLPSTICLFLALSTAPSTGEKGTSAAFILAKGKSAYFYSNHLTGATFTELKAGGTFRVINREHMFVAEVDAGRWFQRSDGELLLCSSYRYQPVVGYDRELIVAIRGDKDYDRLPALNEDIAVFLRAHDEREFPPRLITKDWPHPRSKGLLVTYLEKKISRADLEAVSEAIPGYVQRGEANLSRRYPRECGGCVFLFEDFPGRQVEDLVARLCGVNRENCDVNYMPFAIDVRRYTEEIGTRQPFVHYPEMNECLGSTPIEIDDMKGERIADPKCGCFPCESALAD